MNRALALGLALLLGCSAAPVAPPPPLPSASAPVASAPPPPAPSATATGEAPEPPSPFYIAVDAEQPSLQVLGKTVLIGTFGSASFLEVRGDALVRREDLAAGVGSCKDDGPTRFRFPAGLVGTSTDAMWLAIQNQGARTSITSFLRWGGARWVETRVPEIGGAILGAYPWRKSTVLLTSYRMGGSDFIRLDGSDAIPEHGPAARDPDAWCRTPLDPQDAVAYPGGLAAVGAPCSAVSRLLVERWSADAAAGVLDVLLPLAKGDAVTAASIAGASRDELYVGATVRSDRHPRPYLARFDGKAWTEVGTPVPGGIVSIARGADGALWIVEEGVPSRLWTSRPGGAWTPVPLPRREDGKPLVVERVQVAPDGTVWLTAGGLLLRTGPARATFAWHDADCPPVVTARPATRCSAYEHVFVLLYTLAKTTPPDYDFPALRAALKGHGELSSFRFAETEENGRRYLVAFPEHATFEPLSYGTTLARLVKDKVPGSSPTLLCGSPRVVRELRVDTASGAVTGGAPPAGPPAAPGLR